MCNHIKPHINACPDGKPRLRTAGQSKSFLRRHLLLSVASQTTRSPYLCPSFGCSSSLWLAFVSGCTRLLSETISGVCPPCKSSGNPSSPGTHSENRYHARPRVSHIPSNFLFGTRAVTYHDRTVCMLPQMPVMLNSAG